MCNRHTSNCPAVVYYILWKLHLCINIAMYNVPKCQRRLSSGGASSLLAAGCLMHTHTQGQKQCKVCCCKGTNYEKNMKIFTGMQENVNVQVATRAAGSKPI